MKTLKIFDLANRFLGNLVDNSIYSVPDVDYTQNFNSPNEVTFEVPMLSPKFRYIINENLVEWEDELYLITSSNYSHTSSKTNVSVKGIHLSVTLQNILNGVIDEIGTDVMTLLDIVLAPTDWSVGIVSVDKNLFRDLQSDEQSVMSNLRKIAEKYDGILKFNSKTKTVDLLNPSQLGENVIRQGSNLKSIGVTYDTSEIVTVMYPFGGDNPDGTGEVNIISVNPIGTSYVENYSYYARLLNKTIEEVKAIPICKREMIWRATEYVTAQDLYDDSLKKLAVISNPKVKCNLEMLDMSETPEYRMKKPNIGENVTIYDEDLGLEIQARIDKITTKMSRPLAMTLSITNEVMVSSIVETLINSSDTVNKTTTPSQQILGYKIKDATIGSAQIADATITNAKIADASIDTVKIKDASITTAKIDALAVKSANIDTLAVKSGNIDDLAVTNGKIANLSVDTAKITDLAVISAKIANLAVDNGKIANLAVDNAKIANLAVDTAKIKDASITTAKIVDLSVDTTKIKDASITNAKIANLSVDNAKIADASITNAKIVDATIDTAKIKLGAITTALIDTGAIGSVQIADGSITDAKIVGLTASKITAGTINASDIEVINLKASNITVGTINGQQITDGAIGTNHIATGAITADQLANGVIGNEKLALGAISANKLNITNHILY